jgi:POT family proton-dependent oligopeptide transporter
VLESFGWRVTPLPRIAVGLLLTALSYVVVAWLQQRVEARESVNLAWQAVPYVIITTGEVLVSTTGLEFAYTQAAPSMKSTIMSFWLLTIAGGHFLIAVFTDLNARFVKATGAKELFFYAGLMFAVSLVFMAIATRVGKWKHTTQP